MHVASSRSRSPSRTHITSPAFELESSGCSRTVLQDVPCVRWMSRRASSPPSVRTLRHGTGSRSGGCASTVRLSHRRHRCRSSSTPPTLRSPSPRVGVPLGTKEPTDTRFRGEHHESERIRSRHAERHRQDHAQRQGQPSGKAGRRLDPLRRRRLRRAEADRLRDLGAAHRRRPQRHVPGSPVLGERRATQLRAASARRRYQRAGHRARPDPLRLCGVRTGGVTDLSRRGACERSGGSQVR